VPFDEVCMLTMDPPGSGAPAATLSAATGGELDTSLRHRELRGAERLGGKLIARIFLDPDAPRPAADAGALDVATPPR
jgi:hypothetical protein